MAKITVADIQDLMDAIDNMDSNMLNSIYISLTANEEHWLQDKENIHWITQYIRRYPND